MKCLAYWSNATKYLSKKDKIMKSLIQKYGSDEKLSRKSSAIEVLLRAIVGQQVSTKAADAIWARINKLCETITFENVTKQEDIELLSCGISKSKLTYIKNICHYIQDKEDDYFLKSEAKAIKAELLNIKGVGEWTYNMFAMFYLLEPDIFPIKDLGIIRSIENNYSIVNDIDKVKSLSDTWSPYKSVASWYLWRDLDGLSTNY